VVGYAVCNKFTYLYEHILVVSLVLNQEFYRTVLRRLLEAVRTDDWNLVRKRLVSLAVRRSYAEEVLYTRVCAKKKFYFMGGHIFGLVDLVSR